MSLIQPRRNHLWIWILWVFLFYGAWSWIAFGLGHWAEVKAHWPITLTMALGSYVAGSTPMGGGTIGFPILVLLFDQPAQLGRDFSFAVQSIGMTSAGIFILARRQPLAGAMLKGAIIGSLVGTPLGILLVAPFVPPLWIKLVFAVVWASFGLLHLWRIREIASHTGMTEFDERWDTRVGLVAGLIAGATVVSVTGVGIDMVIYTVLVLLCRADLRIAIPTSVVIMAATSLIGIATKLIFTGIEPGVFENWMAAAPIVLLGAPLGALVVEFIGRRPTLVFVAFLCIGQFVWTCFVEKAALGVIGLAASLVAVAACLFGFEWLRARGAVLAWDVESKRDAGLNPPG